MSACACVATAPVTNAVASAIPTTFFAVFCLFVIVITSPLSVYLFF
ncbi:hypothetical protein B4086_5817 [Bacillus cereus]|nr:hypothetical protein B4086_5817 [Bacillus cereus]